MSEISAIDWRVIGKRVAYGIVLVCAALLLAYAIYEPPRPATIVPSHWIGRTVEDFEKVYGPARRDIGSGMYVFEYEIGGRSWVASARQDPPGTMRLVIMNVTRR